MNDNTITIAVNQIVSSILCPIIGSIPPHITNKERVIVLITINISNTVANTAVNFFMLLNVLFTLVLKVIDY